MKLLSVLALSVVLSVAGAVAATANDNPFGAVAGAGPFVASGNTAEQFAPLKPNAIRPGRQYGSDDSTTKFVGTPNYDGTVGPGPVVEASAVRPDAGALGE